jgi:hypothetical protein
MFLNRFKFFALSSILMLDLCCVTFSNFLTYTSAQAQSASDFSGSLSTQLLVPLQISPVPLPPMPPHVENTLLLGAAFTNDGPLIRSNLQWRVFSLNNLTTPLKTTDEPIPVFDLDPSEYVVHVTYGLASASRKIIVGKQTASERLVILAGGLSVKGTNGGKPIMEKDLRVSVYIPTPTNAEDKLLSDNVAAAEILRLPEGNYHVVTAYGGSNSIVMADIRVQTGKLTEVTVNHKAARITLKLVSKAGSEATANTAWTVLTPGGDVIREELSAFPTMILSEGTYTAIARNDGKTFTGEFKVSGTQDQDIEILRQNAQKTPVPTR